MSVLGRAFGRKTGAKGTGLSPVTAGAILLVLVVVLTYLGFTKTIPFRHHFQINAVFNSSNLLKPNSPVRIAGVEVGKVASVKAVGKGLRTAMVTMQIYDNGRPIHTDATAKIRPRIFLEGNFFVDMTAGSPTAPILEDGGTIPVAQTAIPVQLDQVLAILKADTREDLRRTLAELGSAYGAGFGRALNQSFEFQPAAFRYNSIVNEALIGQGPHDLSQFIRDSATVAAAIDRSPRQLKGLLTDFNSTAAALADVQGSLRATFRELPTTLTTAKPTLDDLNAAFPDVRRLARGALPGVRTTGPTIDLLLPLVEQLRGLVSPGELQGFSADLRNTVPGLSRVATDSVPLLRKVREASSCQNEVILPWTKDKIQDPDFPTTGQVYQEAVKFLPGLAGESRSFDANGQWFKVLGGGGLETFTLGGPGSQLFGTSLFPFLGTNPPKPQGRPPLRPNVPCETQERPDLRTIPGRGPKKVPIPLTPLIRERQAKAALVAIDSLRAQLLTAGSKLKVFDLNGKLPKTAADRSSKGAGGKAKANAKGAGGQGAGGQGAGKAQPLAGQGAGGGTP